MELVIVLGAIVVAIVVLGWVFKLIKNTIQTALLVSFLLMALYFIFGIGPSTLWQQLQTWLSNLLSR